MFASVTRHILRQAPLAGAAAAGSMLATPPQLLQCSQVQKTESQRHSITQSKNSAVTLKTGTEFVKLFVTEYRDSTGALDVEKQVELSDTAALLEGAGGKVTHAEEMFDMINQGPRGTITFAKIIAYFLAVAEGSQDEKMSFLFQACDTDLSGSIEPSELKTVVQYLMKIKVACQGMDSVFEWAPELYADLQWDYFVHVKANEFVHDVFTHATRSKNKLSEKEFRMWHLRGGKETRRLDTLLGLSI